MTEQSKRKPVIGITSRLSTPEWVGRWAINYMNRVEEYDGVPVVLATDAPTVFPDGAVFAPDELGRMDPAVLDRLDGLILAGGGDVHPRYFGEEMDGASLESIDEKRDELELILAKAAMERDMPLFGICRGCQVLNVAAGGGMIQHFDHHRSSTETPTLHGITIDPASRLGQIVAASALDVNTYHHQGIDRATLAPVFQATAFAAQDPWLIEAYESPAHRWMVGVQWHPERIFDFPTPDGHRRLWDDFMAAAGAAGGSTT